MKSEYYTGLIQMLLIKVQHRDWRSVLHLACELYALEYVRPDGADDLPPRKYVEAPTIAQLRIILADPAKRPEEKMSAMELTLNKAMETLMRRETKLSHEQAWEKTTKWMKKKLK